MNSQYPIPVTVLTGFLGSGKTTLVNELLKNSPNKRFAIIENEIGQINIDSSLIKRTNGTGVFELTNGCICCSINADLGITLNSIIVSATPYDHLLVEATGIAAPADIVQTFIEGARVQRYFKLNSVVCIVDAVNFEHQNNKFKEPAIQIAQSDIILINKTDCVSLSGTNKLQSFIKRINPFATVINTQYGITPDINLLESNAHESKSIESSLINFRGLEPAINNKKSKHDIQSFAIEIIGDFEMQRISSWIESYLYVNSSSILRIKGLLSIEGMKHKIILQSVSDNFQVLQGSLWENNQKRCSTLVFIGSEIDAQNIKTELEKLVI